MVQHIKHALNPGKCFIFTDFVQCSYFESQQGNGVTAILKWASRMSHVSTPFNNLCLIALKIPTSDHGIAGSNPAGGENLPERKRCLQPFMSTLQSSRYDWNTVERDVKPLNHPLSIIGFNITCYREKVSILIGLGMREEHLYGAFFRIVLMPLSVTYMTVIIQTER